MMRGEIGGYMKMEDMEEWRIGKNGGHRRMEGYGRMKGIYGEWRIYKNEGYMRIDCIEMNMKIIKIMKCENSMCNTT